MIASLNFRIAQEIGAKQQLAFNLQMLYRTNTYHRMFLRTHHWIFFSGEPPLATSVVPSREHHIAIKEELANMLH